MNNIFMLATLKADEVRRQLGLNIFQPINIYDSCQSLQLPIRFVDINMEGLYLKHEGGMYSTILISNQRPFPRRCFTAAHELGHHIFNHGTKLDPLSDKATTQASNDKEEILVDSFAGALLMPIAGIEAEFAKRNWRLAKASPIEFYIISSVFGIGYQTLIVHCRVNGLINNLKEQSLLKHTPGKLLKDIFASVNNSSHFKIIDSYSQLSTIDLEVSNYIILPSNAIIKGDHLRKYQETPIGTGYLAIKPGITQATSSDGSINSFIRIQNLNYIGLAEYRHLENLTD